MSNITDLETFEQDLAEATRSQGLVINRHMALFFLIFILVITFFAVPFNYFMIPTKTSKTEVNPFREPVQVNVNTYKLIKMDNLAKNEVFYIMPMAKYSISGRLTAKNTFFFMGSDFDNLALIDLGLVWGDLADDDFFYKLEARSSEQLDGSRGLMTYFDRNKYNDLNIKYGNYILTHFSHTHVIPANKKIMTALKSVRYGQKVKLEGYLVDVYNKDKRIFGITSMSRTDINETSRGGGACEIMYVSRVQIGKKIFE